MFHYLCESKYLDLLPLFLDAQKASQTATKKRSILHNKRVFEPSSDPLAMNTGTAMDDVATIASFIDNSATEGSCGELTMLAAVALLADNEEIMSAGAAGTSSTGTSSSNGGSSSSFSSEQANKRVRFNEDVTEAAEVEEDMIVYQILEQERLQQQGIASTHNGGSSSSSGSSSSTSVSTPSSIPPATTMHHETGHAIIRPGTSASVSSEPIDLMALENKNLRQVVDRFIAKVSKT